MQYCTQALTQVPTAEGRRLCTVGIQQGFGPCHFNKTGAGEVTAHAVKRKADDKREHLLRSIVGGVFSEGGTGAQNVNQGIFSAPTKRLLNRHPGMGQVLIGLHPLPVWG